MAQINDARDRIDEILNEKEYRIYYDESRNVFQEWWNKVKEWLADLLESLFPAIESGSGAADVVLIMVILAAILLVGIAVFLLVRNQTRKA